MEYEHPEVYIEEISLRVPHIKAAATAVTGFVGTFPAGPVGVPVTVDSVAHFTTTFGAPGRATETSVAVQDFFANGGAHAVVVAAGGPDQPATADELIDSLAILNPTTSSAPAIQLLCMPEMARRTAPFSDVAFADLLLRATDFCVQNRILLLVDPNVAGDELADIEHWLTSNPSWGSTNSALYFPRLHTAASRAANRGPVAASGAVAGVIARTDARRGVWKAPAGPETSMGALVATELSDQQQSPLNREGVNLIRRLAKVGTVIWGARTGSGSVGDSLHYLAVRRTALFIEHSLHQGLQWVIGEPNNALLWERIDQSASAFMRYLWRSGALVGAMPEGAFFVRCDDTTMTRADRRRGRTIVEVGFAPVRPAEFVVLRVVLERR